MKKFIVILFALFAVQTFSQEKVGELSFETKTIDYGVVEQHSDGKKHFSLTNTGDAPIVIEKIKPSCGCTVVSKPTEPILPGETVELEVKYATNRLGQFSKTITITSNAKSKVNTLRIKGLVLDAESYISATK